MPEKKQLGAIHAITDDDTGMYQIGEVDGGFNGCLEDQVRRYGSEGLLKQLAYMTHAVIEMQRHVSSSRANASCAAVNTKEE